MVRSAVALLLAFFLMLIVIMLGSESLLLIQRIAQASGVQGEAQYRAKGESQWAPLAGGTLVRAGSQVRTGADASATFTWSDGTKVKVGPNSRLTVEKCYAKSGSDEEVSLFRLEQGCVWTRIAKKLGRQGRFEVATPSAVAGVRGTIFSVEARQADAHGGAVISVFEGEVELRTSKGKRVVPGGSVAVVAGPGEVEVRLQQAQEIGRWLASEDIVLPSLRVTAPRNGEKVGSDSVWVSGWAEPGSSVTVNGVPADPRPSGDFRSVCRLRPGSNAIEVVAKDHASRCRTAALAVVSAAP